MTPDSITLLHHRRGHDIYIDSQGACWRWVQGEWENLSQSPHMTEAGPRKPRTGPSIQKPLSKLRIAQNFKEAAQ